MTGRSSGSHQAEAADGATYRLRLAKPCMGEEEVDAIRVVLESGALTNGRATLDFETRFARRHDVRHAVAFANGTVALAAIYLALGIGPGDEVIVPSLTFVSTATAVLHVGARPIFADVRLGTYTLDPVDVLKKVTTRTKAVVAVHYAGQAADLRELQELCAAHNLQLVEDAAEAHGAAYAGRAVGGFGIAAMFSFTPTKNMTTGEGGIVTTDDDAIDRQLRLLRNHGQTGTTTYSVLGYNWRMTEMQAAVGSVQLCRLDAIIGRKQRNAATLGAMLRDVPDITVPATTSDRSHTYMLYSLRIHGGGRARLQRHLAAAGMESRVYFRPAHQQPVFSRDAQADLPITNALGEELLSVPFHSQLSHADLTDLATTIREAMASYG